MHRYLLGVSVLVVTTLSGCRQSECCSEGNFKRVARTPVSRAAAAKQVPLQVGGEVVPPVLIRRVEPTLSDREKRTVREQPFMLFELVVDESGDVTNVRTLKTNDERLVQHVAAAIKQWKFRPATLRGKPVTVFYNITFSYEVR